MSINFGTPSSDYAEHLEELKQLWDQVCKELEVEIIIVQYFRKQYELCTSNEELFFIMTEFNEFVNNAQIKRTIAHLYEYPTTFIKIAAWQHFILLKSKKDIDQEMQLFLKRPNAEPVNSERVEFRKRFFQQAYANHILTKGKMQKQ